MRRDERWFKQLREAADAHRDWDLSMRSNLGELREAVNELRTSSGLGPHRFGPLPSVPPLLLPSVWDEW